MVLIQQWKIEEILQKAWSGVSLSARRGWVGGSGAYRFTDLHQGLSCSVCCLRNVFVRMINVVCVTDCFMNYGYFLQNNSAVTAPQHDFFAQPQPSNTGSSLWSHCNNNLYCNSKHQTHNSSAKKILREISFRNILLV